MVLGVCETNPTSLEMIPSREKERSIMKKRQSKQIDTKNDRSKLPRISFERRRKNRELPVESVIDLIKKEAPRLFELAEVVGKWVWIQFKEKQPPQVTAQLAELGFHWNNRRQVWQHPCGAVTEGTQHDPREKYQTCFPADFETPYTYNGPARTAEEIAA
jgi:hypothetical protein